MTERGTLTAAILLVVVVFLLSLGGWLLVMGAGVMGMGGWPFIGHGLPNPFLGTVTLIFWLLWIVGLILIVVWLVRRIGVENSRHRDTPLAILERRYAKGEIDREQFDRMKRDLGV